MPLERYDPANCFEGEDGSVNFAMRDAAMGIIVPCWISGEALIKLCESAKFRDSVESYEACKAAVHAAASLTYDRMGRPGSLRLELSDLDFGGSPPGS